MVPGTELAPTLDAINRETLVCKSVHIPIQAHKLPGEEPALPLPPPGKMGAVAEGNKPSRQEQLPGLRHAAPPASALVPTAPNVGSGGRLQGLASLREKKAPSTPVICSPSGDSSEHDEEPPRLAGSWLERQPHRCLPHWAQWGRRQLWGCPQPAPVPGAASRRAKLLPQLLIAERFVKTGLFFQERIQVT